jgi:hypothetical protein
MSAICQNFVLKRAKFLCTPDSCIVDPSWFSSAFHKEVSSFTASAQARTVFLLRVPGDLPQSVSTEAWTLSFLLNDDCGEAGGRPAVLEGESPGGNRIRA